MYTLLGSNFAKEVKYDHACIRTMSAKLWTWIMTVSIWMVSTEFQTKLLNGTEKVKENILLHGLFRLILNKLN